MINGYMSKKKEWNKIITGIKYERFGLFFIRGFQFQGLGFYGFFKYLLYIENSYFGN